MNLEETIHQRWEASQPLEALLPAARLKTGLSPGDAMPYATLLRRRNRTTMRTNAGDAVDEAAVQIDVWCDNFDAGLAIVEQIKTTFDRSSFDLSGGARVVQMRRTRDASRQDADGAWRFTVEFLVHVHLPLGT